jgi:hypothetical protein
MSYATVSRAVKKGRKEEARMSNVRLDTMLSGCPHAFLL